ncbi:hypothetical protein RJ639_028385 [Escallonia herrerae]|uniref:Reverse transcriptase Ty1/copia-type domain-containing protein n=1 Tax=Escallonia herrerae TaxID=1293975 RepID=A0AA88X6X8_9ASTE|nr:hypothetical protein RJ639_028385 [Escallonia herrerae]
MDITMATSETNLESGPNYILNGLDNALYNIYSPMVNAKALWKSLERKYKTEDVGSKKFIVGKFLDFKMVDSKTVISQVQEFQLILYDIHAEGMHKRKEMKLKDLIVRLRIEEDNRQSEKKAGNYHQEAKANVVEQENEPRTYSEAMSSPEAPHWKEAVNSEIESIMQNHTWELVDLPPRNKPLGCKLIFKRKMKADGVIEKYKARLVVKGYRQKEGLDYFDTYSPITRITAIRILIAIAAINNLEIHQMDVKTAFLNGDLNEKIYIEQPEGFVAPNHKRKVCKLVKSLYRLKQALKQWHEKFDRVMIENGFRINECDKCVYVKGMEKGHVIVCLYVDDMLIIGSNNEFIKATKKMLTSKFEMKDMGVADVILEGFPGEM